MDIEKPMKRIVDGYIIEESDMRTLDDRFPSSQESAWDVTELTFGRTQDNADEVNSGYVYAVNNGKSPVNENSSPKNVTEAYLIARADKILERSYS